MSERQQQNRLKQHQVVKLVNYLQSQLEELDGLKDSDVASQCTQALGFDVVSTNIGYIRTTPEYECTWKPYGRVSTKKISGDDLKVIANELQSICNQLSGFGLSIKFSEAFKHLLVN